MESTEWVDLMESTEWVDLFDCCAIVIGYLVIFGAALFVVLILLAGIVELLNEAWNAGVEWWSEWFYQLMNPHD